MTFSRGERRGAGGNGLQSLQVPQLVPQSSLSMQIVEGGSDADVRSQQSESSETDSVLRVNDCGGSVLLKYLHLESWPLHVDICVQY